MPSIKTVVAATTTPLGVITTQLGADGIAALIATAPLSTGASALATTIVGSVGAAAAAASIINASSTITSTSISSATAAAAASIPSSVNAIASGSAMPLAAVTSSIATAANNDSDDDMSGAESQRSGSSRGGAGPERDSSGEDADEPDSDDSSEMDESECERRRNECIDNLANLERQFGVLREQLYDERLQQVNTQLLDIREGRSQEYLGPLQELNENLRTRTEVASVLRSLKMANIQHKFDSEELAAQQHFESEKRIAWETIYEDLIEKVRRLEEDRHNVDISWADWGTSTRTSKVRGPGKKKAITVTGPYIVYMLSDEDILEDWKIIRKALKRTPSATVVAGTVGSAGS